MTRPRLGPKFYGIRIPQRARDRIDDLLERDRALKLAGRVIRAQGDLIAKLLRKIKRVPP